MNCCIPYKLMDNLNQIKPKSSDKLCVALSYDHQFESNCLLAYPIDECHLYGNDNCKCC